MAEKAAKETRNRMIFVTGYFGAPIREEAERIGSCKGWSVRDLDAIIEEKDGRSIARLCMMGGEHAYRNAEYEAVAQLLGQAADWESIGEGGSSKSELDQGEPDQLVVACGDGVLYDEDTRALILHHDLVIAGGDQPLDELWEKAKKDEQTYHAFMKFGSEEEKRKKFEEHHERQRQLFEQIGEK